MATGSAPPSHLAALLSWLAPCMRSTRQDVYPLGLRQAAARTCEKGERSGLVPEAMVASLQTIRKDTIPNAHAAARVTQGLAVQLQSKAQGSVRPPLRQTCPEQPRAPAQHQPWTRRDADSAVLLSGSLRDSASPPQLDLDHRSRCRQPYQLLSWSSGALPQP